MTVSNLNLTLRERNDETIFVTITQAGAPYDLTGNNLECWIKTAATYPDEADDSYSMSTVTGEITITDPLAGTATIEVPNTSLPAPGKRFIRVDVISADNKRKTAAYGSVTVIDL